MTSTPTPKAAADRKAEKGQIRQANESAILRAAEQVFARAGFEGATMADIAAEAGLPKANLHYYFGNKRELYGAVLDAVLHDWLAPLEAITEAADPAEALTVYITLKMSLVHERPDASRVFANELLHGAPVVGDTLRGELKELVGRKSAVLDTWIAMGRMAAIDSTHLFFSIWAATQTYADFDVQVRAVLGRAAPQTPVDQARATAHVVRLILGACGLLGVTDQKNEGPTLA
ncbi:MAG: TetR/AcrR family transcriptional regulator [Rubrivivax sp.]|nr:MAG: TetR/AcrR family transcriptional regulator [Rubrivivax sp.]